MRFFDRKTTFFVTLFTLFLIFMPKINLIKVGESETAGIRIDDLVLLGFSVFFFWAHISLRKKFNRLEKGMLAILGFSIISFIANQFLVAIGALHVEAKIFYALRFFEYFTFFYIGLIASRQFKLGSIMVAFVVWNMLLMAGQKLMIVGMFGSGGYIYDSSRTAGIASFPSEMGLLLNMAFCYLIFSDEWRCPFKQLVPIEVQRFFEKNYLYALFFLFMFFVFLTGARIAILVQVLCFLVRLKDEFSFRVVKKAAVVVFFVLAAAGFIGYKLNQKGGIAERSKGLASWKNLELVQIVWNSVDVDYVPTGNEAVDYEEGEDKSWWIRIHKWCYATRIYLEHPECYLQGVGPGFAMAALDGGFLRILVEYGIVGFFLFGRFFWILAKSSRVLFWIMAAISFNMIFFDVYMAYKAMSLLFLMTGYLYQEERSFSKPRIILLQSAV